MADQALENKIDRNKIYFLVIIIALLVAVNGYLYFKGKQQDGKFVTASTEKDQLKVEVEKIEVELDRVDAMNVVLSDKLSSEQKLAREKIALLKAKLLSGEITKGDLEKAREQIKQLREFVKNHNDEVVHLERENSYLKNERDSLRTNATIYNQRATNLRKENRDLNEKIKIGAALKSATIDIAAFRVKDNGKNILTTRASSANKLAINFSIASNPLATKSYHQIYLRVFDPAGNLIADDTKIFNAEGQKMQYSEVIEISYNDDNTSYQMEWVNPNEFVSGVYSVILYADGFTMGKSDLALR